MREITDMALPFQGTELLVLIRLCWVGLVWVGLCWVAFGWFSLG